MTGRWMMAAIQTSFAVMPALVYLFAGWTISRGSTAITIGTIVAFTTLQTRLFFPIGGLLGVQLDVQSSLALFDRIFEYLDQPVDIVEGTERVEESNGDVAFDNVWFRYGDDAWTLEDVTFTVPAGTTTALVGETGSGKTTCAYLVARLYDATEGRVTIDGARRPRADVPVAHRRRRGRLAGDVPVPRVGAREPPLRAARGDRRGDRGGSAGRPDPRAHRVIAGRLRHGRRRARLPILGRREAADRDRAHDPPKPADPRAGRGDLRAGHADRACSAGGARAARGRPHRDRHRAPSLDRARRRPDRRARPRARRRAWHARRAAGARRPLRGARRARRRPRRAARTRREPESAEGAAMSAWLRLRFRRREMDRRGAPARAHRHEENSYDDRDDT